jgi:hypothetical protein
MKNVWILILFLLTACSTTQPILPATPISTQNTASGYPQPPTNSGYPAPGNINATAYPAATADQNLTSGPTPTFMSGTGIVTGTILLNGAPVKNFRLYLAYILKNAQGVEMAASIDPAASPTTFTDQNGMFKFVNVAPKRYSLVLNNALNSYMLFKPKSRDNLIIDVTTGNFNVDIGILDYDELPINPSQK